MRLLRLLPISLLFACGDDGNAMPDAKPRPDAPPGVDAAIDSPMDDGPKMDSAPGVDTRIWAVGDIQTDLTLIAVGFDNLTALPINTMTPPIKVPAMGTELFEGPGSTDQVFDASSGKIAYIADSTEAARFDLYAANADGSSPVLLVQGGQANIEITAVSLSPDGTKVAFTMDSLAVDNGYDLYMVATTNPQAPVMISPVRPTVALNAANMDVLGETATGDPAISWSADSKYVAFSGDLTESDYDQLYVVDTTVATPTAVPLIERNEIMSTNAGSKGVAKYPPQFDSQSNIYFRARIDADSTQFKLYKAAPTGAASRIALALPARGDASTADVAGLGVTPDGTKIVFAADAPTAAAYNLYVSPLDNFVPTAISNVTEGRPVIFAPFWFSADGTKVAVVADYTAPPMGVARRNEAYVIHLDGSTLTPRRVGPAPASCIGTCNAEIVQWSTDGTKLYIMGDLVTGNDVEIYVVDPAMTDPTPTLVIDLPMGADATKLMTRPL